jgi:hypothetical protein
MIDEHITMDGEEIELLELYESQFGETPPVAFLDSETSKRMLLRAFQDNRPFNEKDVAQETKSDDNAVQPATWPRYRTQKNVTEVNH